MDADMLRRWWRDHGEIDRAVEEIRLDLGRGELAPADERLARLAAALERHFATEEEIYFPLAERTSTQSARLLDRARWGHQQLREALEGLRVMLDDGDVVSAHRALERLLHGLQVHEEQEVAILVEFERLVSAASAQ
jgi:hypothetical protein